MKGKAREGKAVEEEARLGLYIYTLTFRRRGEGTRGLGEAKEGK